MVLPPVKSAPANLPITRRLAQAAADHEWLVLALLLPAALFPSPLRFGLLLAIPLLWLARKIGYGTFVVPTPLDLALALLAFMLLVSLYATFNLAFSLPKIAGLVYGLGVYFAAVAAAGRSRRRLAWGTGLLLACGLAVSTLSLVGTQWKSGLPLLSTVTAWLPQLTLFAAAPEGFSPNQLAGTLLWVLPVAIAGLVISRRAPSFWLSEPGKGANKLLSLALFLALILMAAVFLLAQSRSAFLGLAAGLLFMALVAGGVSRLLNVALMALFLGLAAAGLWLLADLDRFDILAGLDGALGLEDGGQTALSPVVSLEGRYEIWSRAFYGLEDFPFTGMGMGTFRRVVPVLYPFFLVPPDQDVAHAHNHLLQTGLDLGLPGLTAYLALWLGTAAMLWRSWHLASSAADRWLALGFAGALLAYFVYGLTETVALGAKPGFIFWLLMGLVAAHHQLIYSRWAAASTGQATTLSNREAIRQPALD